MRLHKEGTATLIVSLVIFGTITILVWQLVTIPMVPELTLVGFVGAYVFLVQFFRNPQRKVRIDENRILAPADGKVVVIERTYESEYLKEDRTQVSIFMSPLNVHSNRNPLSGVISYFKYHPGKYLVAWHPKSSTKNERTTLVYKNSEGVEILVRQIAGAMARRIRWYVNEADEVSQGEEFGFIKFGSRVDLFLPLNYRIEIEKGQQVKAGISVIASSPE